MAFDPAAFVADSRWTFAKTIPTIPTSTPCAARPPRPASSRWSPDRMCGYERRWRDDRPPLTYLEFGGWKYWTMGGEPVEETT